MYSLKLTYSSIDRLFYVYLLKDGQETGESRHFTTEAEARSFMNFELV